MNRAALVGTIIVLAASLASPNVWATSTNAATSANSPPTAPPTPPPGWEIPPPLDEPNTAKGNSKKNLPACCAYDDICCSRQSDINNFVAFRPVRSFSIRLADLPQATVKEAPKDGPYIDGVADVRVIDGTGRPFPWPDGPKSWEIRITPPGALGDIKFFDDWPRVYFDKMEYRGMGSGTMRTAAETPDKGRSLLVGPIEYWTFNRGENDVVLHDQVKGKLDGSPKVLATYWLHAEAKNLAEGVVAGYRALHEGEEHAFFIMPEVLLGFESKDAKTFGGFFRSRFSSAVPYTVYRFPVGPGRSNMINCVLRDFEVRRWFDRPKDAKPFPEATFVVIAMSQTTVESDPKVRILFF